MVRTLDVETTDLDPQKAIIKLIAFRDNSTGQVIQSWDIPQELVEYLANPNNVLRGHNVKYDALCLSYAGYMVACKLDDTKLLAYLRYPNEENGLKYLTKSKLRRNVVNLKDIAVKPKKKELDQYVNNPSYVELAKKEFYNREKLLDYNKADIINCDDLKAILPTTAWYTEVEQPVLRLLFETEFRGARIDVPYLRELDKSFEEAQQPIYERLSKEAPIKEFNPRSPDQVREILVKMGVPIHRICEKTDGGNPSVDKAFLKRLAWLGNSFCKDLLEYRKFAKLRSTYTSSLVEGVDKGDRIHGSFNQAGQEEGDSGTKTGRLTSSNPNLQQIPSRTQEGKKIRKAFIPTEGYKLFDFDLKQIEPRLVAHFSQSSKLLHAYKNGIDTHGMFGADIFSTKIEDLTKTQRFIGKTSWLATTYGCWYKKLLRICELNSEDKIDIDVSKFMGAYDSLPNNIRLGLLRHAIDETEARDTYAKWMFFNEVQESFKAKNPEIMSWRRAHLERTKRCGYITTIGGRQIKVDGLDSKNEWDVKEAERFAVNYLIQGSAADIMKLILVRFKKEFVDRGYGHLLAVVHDEILGEFKAELDGDKMVELLKDIMCNTVKLNNVPVEADGGLINNWGDKK